MMGQRLAEHGASPQRGARIAGQRHRRGAMAHLSGLAAEDCVARHLTAAGADMLETRWRGPGGEIDLICREGQAIVFVEVKQGPTHDAALARITQRQADRIGRSAMAYLETTPNGSLTDMRIDVAAVDGRGEVRIVENAFAGAW